MHGEYVESQRDAADTMNRSTVVAFSMPPRGMIDIHMTGFPSCWRIAQTSSSMDK